MSPEKSTTRTLKLQGADMFPPASTDVQVTLVSPKAKTEPLAGVQLTVTPGQLSVAVGMKLATAPHCPGVLAIVMSAGQASTGACPSAMVT
jgi:hypothetical protein